LPALLAVTVLANGAPVKIFLNYLPDFSNYGPIEASGVAQISIGEAWINLEAQGMPLLTNEEYEVWIQEVDTNKVYSLGRFNANADGTIRFALELDDLPVKEYRYLFVTVEPNPDPSPNPDPRVSIAGLFPEPRLEILDHPATPTIELSGNATPPISATGVFTQSNAGVVGDNTGSAPRTLPVTGAPGLAVAVGLALAGVGAVLFSRIVSGLKQ
jgi:hypothetical protein